jgi:leader peptidase (prepilin peptidase)/N-methyltransferase
VLAVVGVALALVDIATHRLPDRLVLPAYAAVLAGLAVAAGVNGDGGRLATAATASLVLAGCYLLLVLARPRQLGLGDLKLAGLLGLGLGWLGWPAVLLGAVLPYVLFSLCAVGLLAAGRVGRRTALPFGPFLVAGTLLVVLAAGWR